MYKNKPMSAKKIESGDARIVAEALGTGASYVSQVINGKRNNSRITQAHARLRILKLRYRKLMISELSQDFKK